MITEDTRIDYERIGEIDEPSVSTVLSSLFGSEFGQASLDQKLALLEAVAYSLREGGSFRENLMGVVGCGPEMPEVFTFAAIKTNEGLQLIAVLHVVIVESYSAEVAVTKK